MALSDLEPKMAVQGRPPNQQRQAAWIWDCWRACVSQEARSSESEQSRRILGWDWAAQEAEPTTGWLLQQYNVLIVSRDLRGLGFGGEAGSWGGFFCLVARCRRHVVMAVAVVVSRRKKGEAVVCLCLSPLGPSWTFPAS